MEPRHRRWHRIKTTDRNDETNITIEEQTRRQNEVHNTNEIYVPVSGTKSCGQPQGPKTSWLKRQIEQREGQEKMRKKRTIQGPVRIGIRGTILGKLERDVEQYERQMTKRHEQEGETHRLKFGIMEKPETKPTRNKGNWRYSEQDFALARNEEDLVNSQGHCERRTG